MAAAMLTGMRAPGADLVIRGAHVLDPHTKIDGVHDVVVRGGEIAAVAAPGSAETPPGAEEVAGEGRRLFPGFVDPHVHLRTPGHEHKEHIETGTRSAAAGGYCAVVAMPNTDPVLDSAPLLSALRDAAERDARVPVGFMPAITRGLQGTELTEMAELREQGAVGFTDDGKPVVSAGMLRRAMRYQKLCGGVSRSTRRTRRSPGAASCTRARWRRGSGWPGSRRSARRSWSPATRCSPATRRRARTSST
ncbi:MAG: amidohydrolase family protein [Solirubrobacterales bacterium]